MPYINQQRRDELEGSERLRIHTNTLSFVTLLGKAMTNSGELNYILTRLLYEYYKSNGGRYTQVNDILGALEGAKLEFYRRVAAPYEDKKIEENGDVY
jgi:hypothetical protein